MHIFALILLSILVGLFLVYTAIEYRALKKKERKKKAPIKVSGESELKTFPRVTALLPVYNEKLVVEKLLTAASRLDYPELEIFVLDDSSDETGELIAGLVREYRAQGVPMRHLRREKRTGFKAGNLDYGLKLATGEFIAIFDADCLPPPDFLRRVMPRFADPSIGFLQTRIAYMNADASVLTDFQASEASHKEDVTTGFAQDGFMASLTGSSCVWRRSCIDDIGGVSQETITEDVDMGYSAQLGRWRYAFVDDVVSLAELPESMASFRVQRQRWARGLAHNAFVHARELFRSPMRPLARVHALTLVFSPMLLALFYVLLLAAPLFSLATPQLGAPFHIICAIFLLAAAFWGWMNVSSSGGSASSRGFWQETGRTVAYILLFFPLSLYYFTAIIQTLLLGKGEFYTTPKGAGRSRLKRPRINYILLGCEIFSFLYAAGSLCFAIREGNYWVCLYSSLALAGFSMTLFFSYSDSRKKAPNPRSVIVTGASGSIGGALAKEYAAPGVKLTLQGRDLERLESLAVECEKLGAITEIKRLDLRDTDAVRDWALKLAENPPDLLVANAGLNTNIDKTPDGEPWNESLDCIKVNLLSVMALVGGLIPAYRARRGGQIAIMSSLAAYYGLVHTPSYSAAKGALKNWGASLRGWLGPEGVKVNVIFPGYVRSPMCDAMPGPKPFLWQPEKAAKFIRKRLERDQGRISFPFPLNLGIWALSILPLFIAMPIAKILGYGK
ncbi:MAG: SDR family NAD(P)-dependent oxidoreductase [Desulfovibrio sp.]|nr:SDR family NAD(P)-dependent oxidoreductase [Desulfovibrio sp.]